MKESRSSLLRVAYTADMNSPSLSRARGDPAFYSRSFSSELSCLSPSPTRVALAVVLPRQLDELAFQRGRVFL